MIARASLVLSVLALAACSASDGGSATPPDAAIDAAPAAAVVKVDCPANAAIMVTTNPSDYVYTPDVAPHAVSLGDIVHFRMAAIHNVTPANDRPSDPVLSVPFGGEACFQFNQVGTYNYICAAHGFRGAITVQ